MKNSILVLNDHRPGNNNQCLALAQEIGLDYKIIKIEYSFWSKLPNFFLTKSPIGITSESKKIIDQAIKNDYPELIISAGRRLASVAVNIKKKCDNQPKIIQIMKPQIAEKYFDLIILPQHDLKNYSSITKNSKNDKVIYSVGALNSINQNNLAKAKVRFADIFEKYSGNKIAVIIGGKTRKYHINENVIKSLAGSLNKISKNQETTYFILNSRRSEDKIIEIFIRNLKCQYVFFDWRENQGDKNPYQAVLAYCDQIITSCDSISMISESCSSGKPTYVFNHLKTPSKKHKKFLDFMLRNKFIKKFDFNKNYLKRFNPKKLQETERISSIIKFKFLKLD